MQNLELCHECARSFPRENLVEYQNHFICIDCKEDYFQKIREGVRTVGTFEYAGFWIRVGAKLIDSVILGFVSMLIMVPMAFLMGGMMSDMKPDAADPLNGLNILLIFSIYAVMIGVQAAYPTFFVGKYAATPGKMMLGLQVLRPDGARLSYLRAFGRFWAEMLSAMALYIGYFMVGFDSEKKSLHDLICDTRVVYKR